MNGNVTYVSEHDNMVDRCAQSNEGGTLEAEDGGGPLIAWH